MKKYSPIGILICLILLVGCGVPTEQVIQVSNTILPREAIRTDVYLEKETALGPYEPLEGVYVGAYVEHNQETDGEMKQYEALMGKDQAFRVFQYSKSGDITSRQILECIANHQVPYIKILPNTSYDLMAIYYMIGDLNTRYQTPIFIELFPVSNSTLDPVLYTKYYEDAYKLIKRYLSDAVIVWSIDWNQVYDVAMYYPGNNMVDWVGLNVSMPKYKSGSTYQPDVEGIIDFWYKTFQADKPMLLSTLAISHFSRIDHTYTIEDTKNKLTYFYETLVSNYPRIKGILYGDVDMYQVSSKGTEDYRLTSQEKLSSHLSHLLTNPIFLSELVTPSSTVAALPMLYTVEAYAMNNGYYITDEHLQSVCNSKSLLRQIPYIIDETSKKYYDLNTLVSKQDGWVAQENLQN